MSLRLCVLASGSRGNSTYIETHGARLLVDAGLSWRELRRRMEDLERLEAKIEPEPEPETEPEPEPGEDQQTQ